MAGINKLTGLLAGYDTIAHGDAAKKTAAWSKATPIPGRDPAVERWDCDFSVIRWIEYGLLTEYGWELDHIVAVALGGDDVLSNLRARHWRNNRVAGATLGNLLTSVGGRRD